MARNGAGTYTLPAGNPVVTGTTISSTWANNTLTDIGTAITGSIAADGQTPITANLPMNNFRHTGVGNATAQGQYASVQQVQNSAFNFLTSVAGTDAITANASITPSAYSAGQIFSFIAVGNNTGSVTLNIGGLGARDLVNRDGSNLSSGDISTGNAIEVLYDGVKFIWINPKSLQNSGFTLTGALNEAAPINISATPISPATYVAIGAAKSNNITITSSAVVTGYISGTTLTITATASGTVEVGQLLSGTNVLDATTILSSIGGGQYTVSRSQTVSSTTITLTNPITAFDSMLPVSVFSGSISGTTLTVTGMTSGIISVGDTIKGSGVTTTTIAAFGTGTGRDGTYTVAESQTASTTTITSYQSITAGLKRTLTMDCNVIFTHNGTSLILPTGVNITAQTGSVIEFMSLGSGNWKCISYTAINGAPAQTAPQIFPIEASVDSNALTVTLNPTRLDFRSSTLTNGAITTINLVNPVSLTVPSGATLGTISAQLSRLIVIAMNVSGSIELAITNFHGAPTIEEGGLVTTTAIDATSDLLGGIYSTTARTDVAYRVIGKIQLTEATAGTWATAPSSVEGTGGLVLTGLNSVGYGQTLSSVIATKTVGTLYYNLTNKPIFINVTLTSTSGTASFIQIDGGASYASGAVAGSTHTLSGIIPIGSSYKIVVSSGTPTIQNWVELS